MLPSILLLLLVIQLANAGTVVKIVEGIEKYSESSPLYSASGNIVDPDALAPVFPDPISGPSSLHFLANYCFTSTHDRWEYIVCPFNNITQRRVLGQKVNLLGVWGHWKLPNAVIATAPTPIETETEASDAGNDTSTTAVMPNNSGGAASTGGRVYSLMQYEEGKSCAEDGDPNAGKGPFMVSTVELVCNHSGNSIELLKVDDSKFCSFHFKLGIPVACNVLQMDEGDIKYQHDAMLFKK